MSEPIKLYRVKPTGKQGDDEFTTAAPSEALAMVQSGEWSKEKPAQPEQTKSASKTKVKKTADVTANKKVEIAIPEAPNGSDIS